jgi:hypothetical protein
MWGRLSVWCTPVGSEMRMRIFSDACVELASH